MSANFIGLIFLLIYIVSVITIGVFAIKKIPNNRDESKDESKDNSNDNKSADTLIEALCNLKASSYEKARSFIALLKKEHVGIPLLINHGNKYNDRAQCERFITNNNETSFKKLNDIVGDNIGDIYG